MSDLDRRYKELEERVARLEGLSPRGPQKFVWTTLSVIIGLFIILFIVGIVQFVSAG
ncbi:MULTISPECIES: hypothetical protein [Paenibacillus]|uniref:Uncharacterized protein n=1 Tax=Paenibacillus agri TaxID=2744309 RepID=A0A850EVH4_9BACL|nr:hypothetical protein [Paenibacillus agri]NUU62832.1 hypothetical protein [Paenibacillus agri]